MKTNEDLLQLATDAIANWNADKQPVSSAPSFRVLHHALIDTNNFPIRIVNIGRWDGLYMYAFHAEDTLAWLRSQGFSKKNFKPNQKTSEVMRSIERIIGKKIRIVADNDSKCRDCAICSMVGAAQTCSICNS